MEETREQALDPGKALGLLQETCAGANWEILTLLRVECMKYWPGKRLTIRYEVEARQGGKDTGFRTIYGKLYRGRRGEQGYRILEFLRDAKPVTIHFPEPVGYNPRHRFLAMTGLEGTPLRDLLHEPSAGMHVAQLAKGLASLHCLNPTHETPTGRGAPDWRIHSGEEEGNVLDKAFVRMEESRLPDPVRVEFREVLEAVQARMADRDRKDPSVIHRDLYPRQVVCESGKVGLVDLDEVCLGEAELDLGNFLAHLKLIDLQERGSVSLPSTLSDAFTSAYRALRPISEPRLALLESASLLRLASLERLGRPEISILGWDRLAAGLIQSARDVLTAP